MHFLDKDFKSSILNVFKELNHAHKTKGKYKNGVSPNKEYQ